MSINAALKKAESHQKTLDSPSSTSRFQSSLTVFVSGKVQNFFMWCLKR